MCEVLRIAKYFAYRSISLCEVLRTAKYFGPPLEVDEGPISISNEIKNVSRQKFFAYEILRIAKYFAYRSTSLCEVLRTTNYFGPPLNLITAPFPCDLKLKTFRLKSSSLTNNSTDMVLVVVVIIVLMAVVVVVVVVVEVMNSPAPGPARGRLCCSR